MELTAALKFGWLQHGDPAAFFRTRYAALRFIGALVERSLRLLDGIG